MLFLEKSTPCGRFTVSITSNIPDASLMLAQEGARSLKDLSDVLAGASTTALECAVALLEKYGPRQADDSLVTRV